ncbi:MAG: hypothetical protein J5U17_09490 [Candidatus Methanoperedens sp.]|nr:hypothetical protein [Candidatus Methanoperedens sp.]MCE8425994.1 hypothetical protein [Candidatus Methanoperedens sp.]MCE8428360.1 hypothetical protein [Candidatus Methanoperedens sp.]
MSKKNDAEKVLGFLKEFDTEVFFKEIKLQKEELEKLENMFKQNLEYFKKQKSIYTIIHNNNYDKIEEYREGNLF